MKAWNINSDLKFEMSLVLRHLSPPLPKLLTLMQLSWRKLFPTCSPSIQLSQASINLLMDTGTEFYFLRALVDLSLYLIPILGQIYITNTRRPR